MNNCKNVVKYEWPLVHCRRTSHSFGGSDVTRRPGERGCIAIDCHPHRVA
jgi:hypothetical protein